MRLLCGFPSALERGFIVLLVLLFLCYEGCEESCHYAYQGGTPEGVEEGVPTRVQLNNTGLITVEAGYLPDYKALWEYLRFVQNASVEPLVVQLYTPQRGFVTTLSLYGEDGSGPNPITRYSAYGLFNNKQDKIIIQVSDVRSEQEGFYRVSLGKPGKAHFKNYSYEGAWQELEFMRLHRATHLTSDNRGVYLKSVSVCASDVPMLCGEVEEAVAAVKGQDLNLTCTVHGGPYLRAIWTRGEARVRYPTVNSQHSFQHTTILNVKNFKAYHMGSYQCRWTNVNFGTSTTKLFHIVELVSIPVNTTFLVHQDVNQVFEWSVRNKRPASNPEKYKVALECEQSSLESGVSKDTLWVSVTSHYASNSTISEHKASLILPENLQADNITCTLYLTTKTKTSAEEKLVEEPLVEGTLTEVRKLGVLAKTSLFREGYHCESGYYGQGDLCVPCPSDHTSSPRSVSCFYVEPAPEGAVSLSELEQEKRQWESDFSTNINVKIGIILGIILLFVLCVSSVVLVIHLAKKYDCL